MVSRERLERSALALKAQAEMKKFNNLRSTIFLTSIKDFQRVTTSLSYIGQR